MAGNFALGQIISISEGVTREGRNGHAAKSSAGPKHADSGERTQTSLSIRTLDFETAGDASCSIPKSDAATVDDVNGCGHPFRHPPSRSNGH